MKKAISSRDAAAVASADVAVVVGYQNVVVVGCDVAAVVVAAGEIRCSQDGRIFY